MIYKRYESPFENKETKEAFKDEFKNTEHKSDKQQSPDLLGLFEGFSNDDILLIGLIIILLAEDKSKRDTSLILTLGFLFLIGYIDAE